MRKTQVALAALALVASSAALATEVKLSGVIDIGVGYAKKVDGIGGTFMENGAYNDHSSLDLNISEDLGNGLKAYASLGMGFNPNGQSDNPGVWGAPGVVNNALFNRQSFIGLSSNDLGSLQLGKQLSPYVLSNVMMMNYNGMFGVGRMTMVPGGTAIAFFTHDAIQYQSPSLAGFTVTAQTNTTTSTRGNTSYEGNPRYTSFSVMGAVGPANVTAAYHSLKDVVSGYNIGATVNLMDGLVGSIGYMSGKFEGEKSIGSWNIGAAYSLTSSLTLSAQYAQSGRDADSSYEYYTDKKKLFNVMLSNALSKRTIVYAGYGNGKNIGPTIGNFGNVSGPTNDRTPDGESRGAVVVGVSHSF